MAQQSESSRHQLLVYRAWITVVIAAICFAGMTAAHGLAFSSRALLTTGALALAAWLAGRGRPSSGNPSATAQECASARA